MEPNRIKCLLNKYYSGEISPEDYKVLLTALKEDVDMAPELDTDRNVLLAIESSKPIMPDNLEERLEDAIDSRRKRTSGIVKFFISGSVAAIILICFTIGMSRNDNNALIDSEVIAKASTEEAMTEESQETSVTADPDSTIKEESTVTEISDENLEEAAQRVDEALLDALSAIHINQSNLAECIESVKISHKTDF